MRILVETSGGGGIVLVVVAALLASHGGAISAAAVAALITLAVVIALALGGLVALLVYRARQVRPHFTYRAEPVTTTFRTVKGGPEQVTDGIGSGDSNVSTADVRTPALEAPAVRLQPEQLAELAEILRRERP